MDVEREIDIRGGKIAFYSDGHVQILRNNGQHELLREHEAEVIADHLR